MPVGNGGSPVDFWHSFLADPMYPEREKNQWARVSLTSRERSKARGLGGTVLAGPLDLSSSKIAILCDPQGAAFAIFEGETDE